MKTDTEQFDQYFEKLKIFSSSYSNIPNDEWNYFKSFYSLVRYKKGDLILKPGDNADWFFFLAKGLVKRYFNCFDGKQYITSFDGENSAVSDFVALIEKTPAKIYIEALEDVDALVADIGTVEQLRQRGSIWERNGRVIAEQRYVQKAKREYELLYYSAEDRFNNFKREHSTLFRRLTQKDIAAYLGVTPESLNRIIKKSQTS